MPKAATWDEIAKRLRKERDEMNQDDLAYEARSFGAPGNLTGSWLSAMKNGKRPLSLDVLEGIAGALGIKPEAFVEYRAGRELAELGYIVKIKRKPPTSPAEAEQEAAAEEAVRARPPKRGRRDPGRRADDR